MISRVNNAWAANQFRLAFGIVIMARYWVWLTRGCIGGTVPRCSCLRENPLRPFYCEFAWAFDLLIDRPVQKECSTIADWLVERGVVPGATLLDAGCGTGRYAIPLGRRGYVVHGIDRSADLMQHAT